MHTKGVVGLQKFLQLAKHDFKSQPSRFPGGSTENILGLPRRPQHLQLPASSSGDSLDIEIRGDMTKTRHGRKSQSVHVGHKHRIQRSPVPAPRMMVPPPRQLSEVRY